MKSETEYWLNNGTFKFLTPHVSTHMPWLGSKYTEMALASELFRISYIIHCVAIKYYISQYRRTDRWSQKLNIS